MQKNMHNMPKKCKYAADYMHIMQIMPPICKICTGDFADGAHSSDSFVPSGWCQSVPWPRQYPMALHWDKIPCGFQNTAKKIRCSNGSFSHSFDPRIQEYSTEDSSQCSNCCFPAAWQPGQQREERGDLFIFSLALLAIFW